MSTLKCQGCGEANLDTNACPNSGTHPDVQVGEWKVKAYCLDCCGCPEHTETPECINKSHECEGTVEYRMPLSGTGKSFPRCDKHWEERLGVEQGLRERYPEQPPSDWSPLDAGESWDEED